jgi:hypothetical protein
MRRWIVRLREVWCGRRVRRVSHELAVARRHLLNEQAAHEVTRRLLSISQAECEALAAVVARDRARVEAETATFARKQAEAEGLGIHATRNR